MSSYSSNPSARYYLEIEWGVTKKLYLDKFSLGDEFFYADGLQIDGHRSNPVRNPVFVYPEVRDMRSNPAVEVLEQFHQSSSLFPVCSIGVEITENRKVRKSLVYKFKIVRVLEVYGGGGDRRFQFYKLAFDDWTSKP